MLINKKESQNQDLYHSNSIAKQLSFISIIGMMNLCVAQGFSEKDQMIPKHATNNLSQSSLSLVQANIQNNNIHMLKLANLDTINNESFEQDTSNTNTTPSTNKTVKTQKVEQVVTTTRGGIEQLLKDASASITVISREDLENKPHRDLAEALADIPGVDIGTELGKTGGLKISIRGMPAQYTLILIDGKRQNPAGDINTTNAGWTQADTSFMPPLAAIERIEVIRGPMSTIYGSDAIGGVVNIITKKKIDKYGVSLGLETTQNENRQFGSGYAANLFATLPIIKNTLGLQLRGRYYFRSPSDVTFKYTNLQGQIVEAKPGYIGSPSMAHIYDIGGRILYNPDSNNHLYFDVQHGYQWYDNRKQQLGAHNSTAPEYIVLRNNYLLSHSGQYEKFSMQNSLQFNQSWNDGRMTNTTPNNPREIQGKDVILESRAFLDLPFDNALSIGGQYWFAWMQDQVALPNRFSQHTLSLFIEDEWSVTDSLKLSAAIREDWNSRFGFHTSPKAYVVWEAIPSWLTVKGGITMGYKAPFLNELIDGIYGFGSQGRLAFLGNPNLKPETSLSAEFTLLSDNDYVEIGSTYFYSLFFDKISSETLSSNTNVQVCKGNYSRGCSRRINVDKAYIQGVELFFGMKELYGITFDMSYTFTDSQQLTGALKGSPLADVVDHRFSAKLGYTWNDLHVYIRGEVQGNRFRGLSPSVSEAQRQALGLYYKPYGLMHLGATYRLNKNFKFNFAIYNLLDHDFADYRQYGMSGNEPAIGNLYNFIQEGRRYWFSVNMDF